VKSYVDCLSTHRLPVLYNRDRDNELFGVAIKTTGILINYRCVDIKCHTIQNPNLLVVLVSEETLKILNNTKIP